MIDDVMRRWLWLLGLPLLAGAPAGLEKVKSVYLLPMGHGLDQYLAERLTSLGILQVVADPRKADAVFTDQLGEAFELRLKELYPPETKQAAGEADKATLAKQESYARISSWGRGRGTVFLVDPHSRAVLWSTYERPRDSSPAQISRTAQRIADRLKRALKGK